MITAYTAQQVRDAEKPLLEAGAPLMHRAAAALAAHLLHVLREHAGTVPGSRLVIVAGSGSNGGDALLAGARLARRGVAVTAVAAAGRLHAEGEAALRAARGRVLSAADPAQREAALSALDAAHVLCDGVLGTGGRAALDDDLAALLRAVNEAPAPVVAVDVPTGVDATTGESADDAVHAEVTVTFGAVKTGLLLPGGAEHAGRIELVDIGLGEHLPAGRSVRRLEEADVRALWPVPGPQDQKYSRGVVTIDAGSPDYPGAGVLSVSGAARAGAGMVRYRGPAGVRDLILTYRPEIVGNDGHRQSLVVGSGLSPEDPRCRAGVEDLLADDGVGVLDAGALESIRPGDRFCSRVVLTPHAGEATTLAKALDLAQDLPPARLASELSRATGATVLLKGSVTVVADGEDPDSLYAQNDATPWLGTAGAGDVLGGIVGTLLGAGLPGARAAALAALVHGRSAVAASHGGSAPLLALDVADHLPAVVAAILGGAIRTVAPRGGA